MAAHQAPASLGFSRQEYWSGLPFSSPMHESEKWKWSCSVVSDPQRPHGLQPTRLLCPWDFPGKSTGVGCHCLKVNAVKWRKLSKSCLLGFLVSLISLEMRMFLFSGSREETSHMRLLCLVSGEKGRRRVQVTFLLLPLSQTSSAENAEYPR